MAHPPELAYYWSFSPVRQNDQTECWAAALDWWSLVTPGVTHVRSLDLLRDYVRYWDTRETLPNGNPNPDYGTMSPENMKRVFEEAKWKMKVEVLVPGTLFTANFVNSHVQKGPLIVGYRRAGVGGHCVCIYGATQEHYATMDPDGARYVGRAASAYTSSPAILVGYPK